MQTRRGAEEPLCLLKIILKYPTFKFKCTIVSNSYLDHFGTLIVTQKGYFIASIETYSIFSPVRVMSHTCAPSSLSYRGAA